MALRVSLVALLAVAAVCTAAPLRVADSDKYFLFRLQECDDKHTIHGLWPQWAEDCGGPAFDKSQVSDLLNDMNNDWPSCESSTESFWEHEWMKHGTCSGMSMHDYFAQAITLWNQYSSGSSDNICLTMSFEQMDCPSSLLTKLQQ